ncbi:hypothetical protein MKX01_004304 [Papaver californicum]|nr:hypothetical protein MKX01_004304 [Papaver californicum]
MLGISIGVILSEIFNDWMVTLLIVLFLGTAVLRFSNLILELYICIRCSATSDKKHACFIVSSVAPNASVHVHVTTTGRLNKEDLSVPELISL